MVEGLGEGWKLSNPVVSWPASQLMAQITFSEIYTPMTLLQNLLNSSSLASRSSQPALLGPMTWAKPGPSMVFVTQSSCHFCDRLDEQAISPLEASGFFNEQQRIWCAYRLIRVSESLTLQVKPRARFSLPANLCLRHADLAFFNRWGS